MAPRLPTALVLVAASIWSPLSRAPAAEGEERAPDAATVDGARSAESDPAAEAPLVDPRPRRPEFRTLRWEEDWSVLGEMSPSRRDEPLDAVKFIPLEALERAWVTLGGQYRLRTEGWAGFELGGPGVRDDVFVLNRLLYHADVRLWGIARAFAEGRSAFSWDRDLPGGRRTADVDELDLQNGFVDLLVPVGEAGGELTLRGGRQELLFGSERLLSPLDWANVRRSFDGVRAHWRRGGWSVAAFWALAVPVDKYELNSADRQSQLYGLWASARDEVLPADVDIYLLGIDRDVAAAAPGFNGSSGDERRFTLGGRLGGRLGESGFDYELEGAWQLGELGYDDIDAFMATVVLGYTIGDLEARPRFELGFDYASGDSERGGDVETFNPLFPDGHGYLGIADLVGRQNVIAWSAGVSLSPLEGLELGVAFHWFLRASSADALYDASGKVLRADSTGTAGEIGCELDLTASYAITRQLALAAGYAHFFAGEFVEEGEVGDDSDVDFAYLALTLTF